MSDAAPNPQQQQAPRRLAKPVVLYDGSCKLCISATDQLRKLDTEGALDWLNMREDEVRARFRGIDWKRAEEEIHLVRTDGRLRVGVDAVREISEMIGGDVGKAASAALDLPGVRQAADVIYSIVAANRHIISAKIDEKKAP